MYTHAYECHTFVFLIFYAIQHRTKRDNDSHMHAAQRKEVSEQQQQKQQQKQQQQVGMEVAESFIRQAKSIK